MQENAFTEVEETIDKRQALWKQIMKEQGNKMNILRSLLFIYWMNKNLKKLQRDVCQRWSFQWKYM